MFLLRDVRPLSWACRWCLPSVFSHHTLSIGTQREACINCPNAPLVRTLHLGLTSVALLYLLISVNYCLHLLQFYRTLVRSPHPHKQPFTHVPTGAWTHWVPTRKTEQSRKELAGKRLQNSWSGRGTGDGDVEWKNITEIHKRCLCGNVMMHSVVIHNYHRPIKHSRKRKGPRLPKPSMRCNCLCISLFSDHKSSKTLPCCKQIHSRLTSLAFRVFPNPALKWLLCLKFLERGCFCKD